MRTFQYLLSVMLLLGGGIVQAADALTIVVMDPLSRELACDCVKGYAQRNYNELGAYLQRTLGIPVEVLFGEDLASIKTKLRVGAEPGLIIGKSSVVLSEAAKHGLVVTARAALTGLDGSTAQHGLIVVRRDSPVQSIADLKNCRILFGPADAEEKSKAAVALLEKEGVPVPKELETSPSCSTAADELMKLAPDAKAAAVISSYAQPLLAGCGTIKKDDLRVVGRTADVPFITAFTTAALASERVDAIANALLDSAMEPKLLKAMESLMGFVELPDSGAVWNQFRGPNRDGTAPRLPDLLPGAAEFAWSVELPSDGIGGIAADDEVVVIGGRDSLDASDFFFAWMR